MKNQNKKFYYYRDRGEYKSHEYTMRTLEIFVSKVKQTGPEITDYYYSGGVKKILSLDYQKGSGKREPQTDIEKHQEYRFYAESFADYQDISPSTETFQELVTLFTKMDKAEEKLSASGLKYERAEDKFLNRVFLLKEIGAKQIEYSSQTHNYYLS